MISKRKAEVKPRASVSGRLSPWLPRGLVHSAYKTGAEHRAREPTPEEGSTLGKRDEVGSRAATSHCLGVRCSYFTLMRRKTAKMRKNVFRNLVLDPSCIYSAQ